MIEWNDLQALEKLFKRHGDEIAAVIMEPTMVNDFGCPPEPGYLEGVRKLCTEYGVVLIFDEVLTGFRIDLEGTQGYFGVTPDMTTLAKALGGGFPVSAFAGKREIMDTLTRADAVVGGTYNGHPSSARWLLMGILGAPTWTCPGSARIRLICCARQRGLIDLRGCRDAPSGRLYIHSV